MATLLLGTTIGGYAAIHAGNIASQSVNYASSAGSVAWSNVTGKPTLLSQFTNDLGNYGSWITASYLDDYTRGAYRVISDYGGNTTWYIRGDGQFIWGRSHDWSYSVRLSLPSGSQNNTTWAYIGQQDSNAASGTWRGLRIRKYNGGNVDGDLSAGAFYIGDTRKDQNWDTAYGWGNHASAGYATTSYVTTQIANLVNSAPSTLDTLNELAAALGNDSAFSTTVTTALGNRLRIDTGSQGLNSTQQGYGRTNLGLGSAATYAAGDFALASHNHSGTYLPLGGSWVADFASYGFTRQAGYSVVGGEWVLMSNNAQVSTLIDGSYFAGENGGFYSLNNANSYTSRKGFYNDGTYANFNTGVIVGGDLIPTHAFYPGYNNGAAGSQTSYYFYGNTSNSGIRTNANLLVNSDIYLGVRGQWLSTYLNQNVRTDSSPTFSSIYLSGSQLTSSMVNGLSNMLGVTTLPYSCDIVVNGDPDRFYAVQFWGGDQDVWRRIIIKRGYSEQAPWDPIGTGVHHGGLLLDWEGNFGGWGGAEYADRIRVFNESYTNVCADMFIYSHSMGYVFMLRGGGAIYHLFSDQAINGFYQSGSPDILYSSSTLSYDDAWSGTNQYDVYAPTPLTLGQVNSSRIDGLRTKKQSLLDGRYLRQGVDISGISNITTSNNISSLNFLASNAYYLNGTSYYLNSTNGGIYTNARFESANSIVSPTFTASGSRGFYVNSGGASYFEANSSSNWAWLRLSNNGNVSWDIASYNGGGLEFRPYGSGTNATIIALDGVMTIQAASDPKLVLRVPSGDSSEWNYINFVGSNGVRDAYFGTDGSGNPTWYRDDNGVNIGLGASGATVNGALIASQTWVSQNYVPSGRTITINGTSYDLSANRSWTVSSDYALSSTRLYASDSPYRYGDGAPYYLYMNYDGGSYWELKVSPATPGTVRVAYANSAGSASTSSQVTVNYNNDSNSTYQLLWGSGNNVYGTGGIYVNPYSDIVYARGGYISPGNPWGTSDSAYFPNGITTAGGDNWIYGHTYVGNAPTNGSGHEYWSDGSEYHRSNVGTASHGQSGRWVTRQSANGNYAPYSFESDNGDHSYGVVARFHISSNSGSDRPSITFSSGYSSTRWSVGYGYYDDDFRIVQNLGLAPNGTDGTWGTPRFRISSSGTVHVGDYFYAYGYRGNGNIGGTGSASWHPEGIYCGSTMWQYGAQYKNGTGIYDVGEIKLNGGPYMMTYNSRNMIVKGSDSGDVGILGRGSSDQFGFQLYGAGNADYGFLGSAWGAWDIRKTPNGNLYTNDNTTYYLNPKDTTFLNTAVANYIRSYGNLRVDSNIYLDQQYGSSIVGVYSSYRYQGVFAMGDSYKLALDGQSTGSLYGMAWSHPNAGGVAGNLNTHGLLVMENGGFLAAISGSIRARDDVRAPYFYGGYSTRVGEIWGYGGLYRSSGDMMFGIENGGWRFHYANSQKVYIGSDGNIWMAWADAYISTLLNNKSNVGHTHDDRYYTESESDSRYLYYRGVNAENDFQRFQDGTGEIRFDQVNNYNNLSNAPGGYNYGGVLSMRGDNFGFQLWGSHTGDFYYKTQWSGDNYSGWRQVITSLNIGSQSVSYASSAGSVAWGNVSGRPTAVSSFSNDSGYLTSGSTIDNARRLYPYGDAIDNTHPGYGLRAWYDWAYSGTYRNGLTLGSNPGDQAYGWQIWQNMWDDRTYTRRYNSGWQTTRTLLTAQDDPYAYNMNQYVRTSDSVTFTNVYNYGWFRNYNNLEGLYSQPNGVHFYASNGTDWNITGSGGGVSLLFRANHQSTVRGYVHGDTSSNFGLLNNQGGWAVRCYPGGGYGGELTGSWTATGDLIAYSDERVKTNISTIDNALNKVLSLRGVTYERTDGLDHSQKIGVIAQEVQKILPQVVHEQQDGMLGVSYGNMVGVLIEAIKEQQKEIEELKAKLN